MAESTITPIHILQRKPALAIQAYLLTAEIPFTVENIYFTKALSTGSFPQLRYASTSRVRLISSDNAISYLKENVYDLDQDLTEDQQILNQLICNTVEKKLNVALLYSHWVGWHFEYKNFDCNIWKNREDIFREAIKLECKVHGIHYIFPSLIAPAASFLNEYMPEQFLPIIFHDAKQSMKKIEANNNMLNEPVESIFNETHKDYAVLEKILSSSSTTYFHSNVKPSIADVVVFEHLSNAFNERISIYRNSFQRKYVNLFKLYNEMNAIYFQQDGRLLNHIAVNGDNKYQMINAENGKKQRKVVEEYKEKLKLTLSTPSNSPTKANIDKKLANDNNNTPRGAFKQAKHYEHKNENNSNKPTENETTFAKKTTKTMAEQKKELYNKAFLAGIMILFGIYALKNYTPEEIDVEDDVYAVY